MTEKKALRKNAERLCVFAGELLPGCDFISQGALKNIF